MSKIDLIPAETTVTGVRPSSVRSALTSMAAMSNSIYINVTHYAAQKHTQPVYGPFSGTTRVIRRQKKNF